MNFDEWLLANYDVEPEDLSSVELDIYYDEFADETY